MDIEVFIAGEDDAFITYAKKLYTIQSKQIKKS